MGIYMKMRHFLLPVLLTGACCPALPELEIGEPTVVVMGIRPEEKLWGPYQFPRPYRLSDRVVVSVHVSSDNITSYADPYRWFETTDGGATWRETDASVAERCGTLLPNGDRIAIPVRNSLPLEGWKFESFAYKTPGYDFGRQAPEGVFPIPDGARGDLFGGVVYAYRSERLAPSLQNPTWTVHRLIAGTDSVHTYEAPVEWPCLTRVVHASKDFRNPVLKDIFPRGDVKVAPDGKIWVSAFSGEGHINPENGCYSPYYSAELFCSSDSGRSFRQASHMEYPADGSREYPYASGGFSDSDIAFMRDGSMLWFMRSNWYGTTGDEWSPMYWTRSKDGGRTWAKPEIFSSCGTLPRLVTLECGVTLLVYGRPGIFLQASSDRSGRRWSAPVEVLSSGDRSHLANIVKCPPSFHDYDGAGGNPEIVALGPRTALLLYSDFYVPDADGVKRKSILCRKITVK